MACLRAGAVQIPRARGRLHEAVRRTESQADGAGGVVVAVRQAPATCPAILSGTSRARCLRSPRLRVGGRAQLEHLRQDQAQGKPKERSQLGGHAKADKLGSSSTAGQGAGRRLQGARVEKWDSDSDSDKSDDEAGLMV